MKESLPVLSAAFKLLLLVVLMGIPSQILLSQGVTTGSLTGIVTSDNGEAVVGANVIAVHEPSGTKYGASTRVNGQYNILNVRIGGPYTVTVSLVGYKKESQADLHVSLGQELRIDFKLVEEAVTGKEVLIYAEQDQVLNSRRTGAATYVSPAQVSELPSVKRSTRDLTRLDPRSDGNFSFGGKNWLYNNISLDGSYFNNPFGLDDPAPGGQANAEPVPFDAVEQVQVSVAPFDVREGGFTGAGINTVTKSGTNQYKGSIYSFLRNESFLGNKVSGKEVVANPSLAFNQSGFTVSGPLIPNELFFFVNAELERREDPGSNFVANRGTSGFGISRVRASTMDSIRTRLRNVYGYDPGDYEGYVHKTDNEKVLVKLDWNADENNNVVFRYNLLRAGRDLPPHPFVLSFNSTGRGPNENSLPFQNSGYRINNGLNSFAVEVNSRYETFANRLFVSYNRFRDFRKPFSQPFPTIEIGEGGVQYTTVGHEPFSVENILDQDVWQFTDNLSYYMSNHVITVGINYEKFSFFNSFNIFKYGTFLGFLPTSAGNPVFAAVDSFFAHTNPANPSAFYDFNAVVNAAKTVPFKGENIDVAQLSLYAQDEFLVSEDFNLMFGIRVDFPIYTNPIDNPFSTALNLRDENGNPEKIDQSKLPETTPLFSPRVGFNWDLMGDRSTQMRGGTGIFTGRLPFVWIGNVLSNPGPNPKLPAYLQSFDLNAADPDFKWPQAWTTNLAVDHKLPWDLVGTLEVLYSKDINAVFVRNANLGPSVGTLQGGRNTYGGGRLNTFVPVGVDTIPFFGGVYVIDNTDEGYNYSITAQLRKQFESGMFATIAYTFLEAKSSLKSTEIASVLWSENPIGINPNKPDVGFSEFGNKHRITAVATYRHKWSDMFATNVGLFVEAAQGNKFAGAGGNRYSFVYSGDVNGDGNFGNDLIYIPKDQSDINLVNAGDWAALNAFIEQDEYLSSHRGQIAERFGAVNDWFTNIDVKILQDIHLNFGTFQVSLDILNFMNMLSSDLGVRKVASSSATSPLRLVDFGGPGGTPRFSFIGPKETFIDDPGLNSRWQAQFGLRYIF
ncbi:MAG: TonB-dependent receptor [Ignavibacteriales bacterium]|nr:TonB-dependent receptor [Ignavibacteriales bacterium]